MSEHQNIQLSSDWTDDSSFSILHSGFLDTYGKKQLNSASCILCNLTQYSRFSLTWDQNVGDSVCFYPFSFVILSPKPLPHSSVLRVVLFQGRACRGWSEVRQCISCVHRTHSRPRTLCLPGHHNLYTIKPTTNTQ